MKKLRVIYGNEQVQKIFANQGLTKRELKENERNYVFESELEKKAFIKGLEAAMGWNCFCIPELEFEIK